MGTLITERISPATEYIRCRNATYPTLEKFDLFWNHGASWRAAWRCEHALCVSRGARCQVDVEGPNLLQVPDELVCEATTADHDQLRDLLVNTMSGVIELAVPLEVDWASGPSWAEAEKH